MRVEVDDVLAQRSRLVRKDSRASVFGSLVVHVLVVGAGALVPFLAAQRAVAVPEFVPVMVVPAQALGIAEPTPAPPRRRPEPEPEPESAPPAPVVEEAEPEPEPEPEPAMPSPTKRPKQTRPKPPRPAPQPSRELGRRQGSATGSSLGSSSAFGVDQQGFADQNFRYSYYTDQMLAMIQSQWQRPSLGAETKAAVFFRIRRDGQITDLRVVESSGFNVFDLAGLRAVQQAAPFPRLPVSYPRKALNVKLYFR